MRGGKCNEQHVEAIAMPPSPMQVIYGYTNIGADLKLKALL
jgi:hypothetical protein